MEIFPKMPTPEQRRQNIAKSRWMTTFAFCFYTANLFLMARLLWNEFPKPFRASSEWADILHDDLAGKHDRGNHHLNLSDGVANGELMARVVPTSRRKTPSKAIVQPGHRKRGYLAPAADTAIIIAKTNGVNYEIVSVGGNPRTAGKESGAIRDTSLVVYGLCALSYLCISAGMATRKLCRGNLSAPPRVARLARRTALCFVAVCQRDPNRVLVLEGLVGHPRRGTPAEITGHSNCF